MSSNWLNRKAIERHGFRAMSDSDFEGMAGAGEDSMIREGERIMMVGDLSYDEEAQGFQFIFSDHDGVAEDGWFNATLEAINAIKETGFINLLKALDDCSIQKLHSLLTNKKLMAQKLDASDLIWLTKTLAVKERHKTDVVADESTVLSRIQSELQSS